MFNISNLCLYTILLFFCVVTYSDYWVYGSIFPCFSRPFNSSSNRAFFALHYTVLDVKCHKNGVLDTLLGRNGLFNEFLLNLGVIQSPVEWFLYSPFAVLLAFVHLYTLFMIVPIFNSMIRIDNSIIEAAYDSGSSGLQILTNIIIPLCKPGILIGSIFVITVVMGDFITIGIMGGQQIASIGKIIQVEMSYLHLPAAAANAVILLTATLLMIFAMTRIIDIRKEL